LQEFGSGGEMVLWLLGVFVFWLVVEIYFNGLACGRELVFWLVGVLVLWLKVKIHLNGVACGFGRSDGFSITIGRVHALMEYAQNSYSVRLLPIDDHMDADGKCSVWLVQVVPRSTDCGVTRDFLNRGVDFATVFLKLILAPLLGRIAKNVQEILSCFLRKDNLQSRIGHYRGRNSG